MPYRLRIDTTLGSFLLLTTDTHLLQLTPCASVSCPPSAGPSVLTPSEGPLLPLHAHIIAWLTQYLAHCPPPPDTLPLAPQGTPFQQLVWKQLLQLPYGHLTTYGQLATELQNILGHPMSPQAIGQAVGRNPIPVIIPCHRVIAAHQRLGGYAFGLPLKRALLHHEGITLPDA